MHYFSSDATGSNPGQGTEKHTHFEREGSRPAAEPTPENFNLIGHSPPLRRVVDAIAALGQYEAPVLITGETGTGKELAARGIHYCGCRAGKPFVAVNCATFSDELFASEVFGHKRGAFTDARETKQGLLATARKGSLFLDEIDSLSIKSQAALLRFLQSFEYRPVGSETVCRADVRIIASCNRDLEALMEEGIFRRDLYYRLYIFSIHMPALRERPGDIDILAEHFLDRFNHQYCLGGKQLSPKLLKHLRDCEWPGNVREFENLIHRLYLSTPADLIDLDAIRKLSPCMQQADLHDRDASTGRGAVAELEVDEADSWVPRDFDFCRDKRAAIESFERQYVTRLLACTGGNVTRAARLCGKERRALGKLVKKYGLKSRPG